MLLLLQKQKQSKQQGQHRQGEPVTTSTAAASAAASALKGYDLASTAEAPARHAKQTPTQPRLLQAQKPAADVTFVKSHNSRNAEAMQSRQDDPAPGEVVEQRSSKIDAKRDSFARKAKRDRAAFEGKIWRSLMVCFLHIAFS